MSSFSLTSATARHRCSEVSEVSLKGTITLMASINEVKSGIDAEENEAQSGGSEEDTVNEQLIQSWSSMAKCFWSRLLLPYRKNC